MPPLPDSDASLTPRMLHLLRVEALIDVGCHYGPNDLPPDIWDQLLLLKAERQYVDRIVEKRREKTREGEAALNKARAASGLPGPGQSLFGSKGFGKK